jgi:hypothetical protein
MDDFQEGVVIRGQQTEHFVLVGDRQLGIGEVNYVLQASQCGKDGHRNRAEARLSRLLVGLGHSAEELPEESLDAL